jgi:hypothetical protein
MKNTKDMVELIQGVNNLVGERDKGNVQQIPSSNSGTNTLEPEFRDVFEIGEDDE